jgi:hypothetical protein
MTEDEFWVLIERSRRDSGGVLGRQVQLLREHFLASPREELLGFRDRWDEADGRLFTWPLWDASCLLLGWVSDDFFDDVRAWIIGHGRDVVDRIVADPDNLVELANDTDATQTGDAERLNMLVWEVWEELTGDDELPFGQSSGHGPTGERIDLKDAQAVCGRFPRLAEFAGITGSRE